MVSFKRKSFAMSNLRISSRARIKLCKKQENITLWLQAARTCRSCMCKTQPHPHPYFLCSVFISEFVSSIIKQFVTCLPHSTRLSMMMCLGCLLWAFLRSRLCCTTVSTSSMLLSLPQVVTEADTLSTYNLVLVDFRRRAAQKVGFTPVFHNIYVHLSS